MTLDLDMSSSSPTTILARRSICNRPMHSASTTEKSALRARELGLGITTVFTTYRDAGAIGSPRPEIREAAYTVGLAILEQASASGAPYAGLSFFTMGRDEAEAGFERGYADGIAIWKRWMHDAKRLGLRGVHAEMAAAEREACSTIAGTRETVDELAAYHKENAADTVPVLVCYDTGHGISAAESPHAGDREYRAWLQAFADETYEIHLKDTDPEFFATWHFEDPPRGIIDLDDVASAIRDELRVPRVDLHLEIPGKRGRTVAEDRSLEEHRQSRERIEAALTRAGYREDSRDRLWRLE